MAELSKKHMAFIDEYMLNGFVASAAYKSVYKNVTDESAEVLGSNLLRNVKVSTEISKRQSVISQKYNITQERMIDEIMELIKSCKSEGLDGGGVIKDRANWAKAIDMMNKIGGIYSAEKHNLSITPPEQPMFNKDEE